MHTFHNAIFAFKKIWIFALCKFLSFLQNLVPSLNARRDVSELYCQSMSYISILKYIFRLLPSFSLHGNVHNICVIHDDLLTASEFIEHALKTFTIFTSQSA